MSDTIVFTSVTGQRRPVATRYELADLRPVRNIRRPVTAKRQPRLTCTPEELAAADLARILRANDLT
jgi:hypothetical protein